MNDMIAPRFENAPLRRTVNREQALRSYDPTVNYRLLREELQNQTTATTNTQTKTEVPSTTTEKSKDSMLKQIHEHCQI